VRLFTRLSLLLLRRLLLRLGLWGLPLHLFLLLLVTLF
jgi:hypothetical protein